MQKILERIKECQKGMTITEFARFLGLKQPSVHFYMTGQRKISVEFLYSVCNKCKVSADWLLGTEYASDRPNMETLVHAVPQVAESQRVQELERNLAEANQRIALMQSRMEGLEFALKAIGRERAAQDAPRERTYTEQEMRVIVKNIQRRMEARNARGVRK